MQSRERIKREGGRDTGDGGTWGWSGMDRAKEGEGVNGWRGGVGASEGVRGGGAIDRMALVASGSKKSRRAESGAVAGKARIRATSG